MLAENHSTEAPLSDTYYLDNFETLIGFVEKHYSRLLSADEKKFLLSFNSLPDPARKLYVRLALRTSNLQRLSKLHYPEIGCLKQAMQELSSQQLISHTTPDIEQCQQLFSKNELKSVGLSHSVRDANTPDSIHWTTPDLFGDSPIERLLATDDIIEVHNREHVTTFRLLFFGNLHQDFSDFVLRDLGLQRYESYVIDSETLLFQTREQIQAHLAYYQASELFDTAAELGTEALQELHSQLPAQIHGDKALTRRLANFNNKIARQLERENALHAASEIYRQHRHPPARERLARIEARQGNTKTAIDLCSDIIESPADTDELDFARTFGYRTAKKAEIEFAEPDLYTPPENQLLLKPQNLNVEFSVALHLAKQGKCYYLENTLIGGVFGLAFWDIIFAPVKGAFFHPFQSKPSDFYESGFRLQREPSIQQRLHAISNGDLHHFVFKHLFEKRGIRNPLINWQILRPHILSLAIQRIPPDDWHAMFRLLLTDIRNYRSGQPDLAFFPDDGGYQLLEVKAPGDRLQKNQLRWMRFFKQQNISHGVVHVEWIDE